MREADAPDAAIRWVRPPMLPDAFQDPYERQNRKNGFDGLIMGCSGLARSID